MAESASTEREATDSPAEAEPRYGDLIEVIGELKRRAEVNSLQIDELQLASAREARSGKKPWYRDASTLIATLALVASIASIIVTYSISSRDRVERDHARLASITSELAKIVDDYNALARTATGSIPPFTESIGKRSLLCNEAYDLIQRSGAPLLQQLTIAGYFLPVGELDKARDLAQRVAQAANDPGIVIQSLRIVGTTQFYQHDLQSARNTYARALATFAESRFVDSAQDREAYDTYTEADWAGLEVGEGQCAEARDHLAKAIARWKGDGSLGGQPKDRIDAISAAVANCT